MNIIFEDNTLRISQCILFLFVCSCSIKQGVLDESKNIINTYLSHEKSCTCQKGHDEFRFRLHINSDVSFYSVVCRQISFICCDVCCRDLIYWIKPFIMGERNIVHNTLFFVNVVIYPVAMFLLMFVKTVNY